jgi:hypothetical protein
LLRISSGAAREHQQAIFPTQRTADAGKPTARVAAVDVALDDFFDDRTEEAILFLKTSLILRQETVELMKQHPVEDGPLGMSRTVNSCHSRSFSSGNGPWPRIWPILPEGTGKALAGEAESGP